MGEHTVRITIGFIQTLSAVMLALGAIALAGSIIYTSTILAFIGLGLVFWGAIILYIRPEEYTKKTLLEAALSPSLTTLNQTIQELGYKGDPIYLPPKYFTDPETTKIYIPRLKLRSLPMPEVVQLHDNKPVVKTMQGMLITPPGIQLSKLLEKSLGKSFIKMNLKDLQQILPKLFVEDLEIAETLELQVEGDTTQRKKSYFRSIIRMKSARTRTKSATIRVKITKPIYRTTLAEAEEPSQITNSIGCPICSAIAIAITKATGKPVRITDTKSFEDDNNLEAGYELMEE